LNAWISSILNSQFGAIVSLIVTLEPIDKNNWAECCRLRVADDQREFVVVNNAYAMAACYADPQQVSLAIRSAEQVVGFVHFENNDEVAELHTIMIDRSHQARGLGCAAMELLMVRLRSQGKQRLGLGLLQENEVAYRLYFRLGFQEVPSELQGHRRMLKEL
jgi:diamine N-acetyltransferase